MFEYKIANLFIALDLAFESLELIEAGELPKEPQNKEEQEYYTTPGLREFLILLLRRL